MRLEEGASYADSFADVTFQVVKYFKPSLVSYKFLGGVPSSLLHFTSACQSEI